MGFFSENNLTYADELNITNINDMIRTIRRNGKAILSNKMCSTKRDLTGDCIYRINKIIFNDPCVILIDFLGRKTIIRTQGKEKFDMMFGYYMVLCKYFSSNDTYSELLAHIYEDAKTTSKRIDMLECFLMGKLGVNLCRKIDFYQVFDVLEELHGKPKTDKKKHNYTINFREVVNG